jgi:putative endonuclease
VWYVFFLLLNNGDTYVGSTNDLKHRISSHQAGYVASTKAHLPAKLKCYVAVETEDTARKLERYFKSGSGKAIVGKRFW